MSLSFTIILSREQDELKGQILYKTHTKTVIFSPPVFTLATIFLC